MRELAILFHMYLKMYLNFHFNKSTRQLNHLYRNRDANIFSLYIKKIICIFHIHTYIHKLAILALLLLLKLSLKYFFYCLRF